MSEQHSGAISNIILTEYGWRKAKRKWGPKMQKVVIYQVVYPANGVNQWVSEAIVKQNRRIK